MPAKQKGHPGLYLLALFCSFAGIACIAFIIYTVPHTLFGFRYNVPAIVTRMKVWYESHYGVVGVLEILAFYLPFLIAAILFFLLGSYLDRYLETHHEAGVPDIPESELKAHQSYNRYNSLAETPAASEFHPMLLLLGILLIVVLLVIAGEFIALLEFF